ERPEVSQGRVPGRRKADHSDRCQAGCGRRMAVLSRHGVIDRFVGHKLSFPECTAALDAALARLVPKLNGGHLASLRALMLANSEAVTREIERRGPMERNSKLPSPATPPGAVGFGEPGNGKPSVQLTNRALPA